MKLMFGANSSSRRRGGLVAVALLVSAGLALSACKSNIEGTAAAYADDEPAGNLYNEGLAYMNAGKLTDAIKSFNEVDRQHPFSEYARKALIMSAFASYRKRNYDDAIASSNRYLALYPNSPDAAYAQYIIGQSNFGRIPDVTRDQEVTMKAMASMQDIITRYPDSEYADDARQKIIVARDQLAGKDMQIGRYYLERREYIAAINRFKSVVLNYQDTRQVEEALERLTEAYLAMGLAGEAQAAAAVLGHNYPNSKWYQSAYNLLQKGGLQPQMNEGWLSRAFGKKTT
jgi:outer membrane protein assembly factor BamD